MQIILYHTHPAAPAASTELPDDPDAAARGRNGWFHPRQIIIWRDDRIWLAVRSRRLGENAPIQLHIARPAAHALGAALLLAAADPAAGADDRLTVPVEDEQFSAYYGHHTEDT